jgi:hypothetical protein
MNHSNSGAGARSYETSRPALSYGDDVRKPPDESPNFPRLFLRGLDLEHIEQISGNTDEVVPWRLFDQPTKPVNAEMKISG